MLEKTENWLKIGREKTRRRKVGRRQRLEALLIKRTRGKSYADVLRDIKSKVKSEETQTDIKSIRPTRNGDVLLELGKQTKDIKAFSEVLK